MKLVEWQDERGSKKKSWVRDQDGPAQGPYGIPAECPDLSTLDWEGIQHEITEALNSHGIFTWLDWQRNPDGATAATGIVKRHLIGLFRQMANNGG